MKQPWDLKGLSKPGHCILCGKALAPEKTVWLALDQRTNTYTDEPFPEEYSQGGFEFGADCAARMRRAHREAQ